MSLHEFNGDNEARGKLPTLTYWFGTDMDSNLAFNPSQQKNSNGAIIPL